MEMFTCPVCGKEVSKEQTEFTYDVSGIPFRRLCRDCADKAMEKGYDGNDYRGYCSEEIEEIW